MYCLVGENAFYFFALDLIPSFMVPRIPRIEY